MSSKDERKIQRFADLKGWIEGASVLWASDLEHGKEVVRLFFPHVPEGAILKVCAIRKQNAVVQTDNAIKWMMRK